MPAIAGETFWKKRSVVKITLNIEVHFVGYLFITNLHYTN